MQPAVQKSFRRVQIIKQLGMPITGRKRRPAQFQNGGMSARQGAEFFARHFRAIGVAADHFQRNVFQRPRHRRGQAFAGVFTGRQNGRGQNKTLPHQRGDAANLLVMRQVVAFHIRMIDAPPPVRRHFIARAHKPFSGANLQLPRPPRVRQQFGNIHRARAEGRNFLLQPSDVLVVAHFIQPHFAGGDGGRMGILHPQQDLFALLRGRESGVEVGRPGVGVVGAAEFGFVVAESVHDIFHNVVAGAVHHRDEELPAKFGQFEFAANVAGVQNNRRVRRAQRALEVGQRFAVFAEKTAPQKRVLRPVGAPVIGGDHAGVLSAFVAEKGEVCGEVQLVQIIPLVRQQAFGDFHFVQRNDFASVRRQSGDLRKAAVGVENRNEKQVGAAAGQAGDGRGFHPQRFASDGEGILREKELKVAGAQPMQGGEGGELSVRIINGGGFCGADAGGHAGAGRGGQRMTQRFKMGESAQAVAESVNGKRHCFSARRRETPRRGFFSPRR